MKSICSVLYCLLNSDKTKYMIKQTNFPGPEDVVMKSFHYTDCPQKSYNRTFSINNFQNYESI